MTNRSDTHDQNNECHLKRKRQVKQLNNIRKKTNFKVADSFIKKLKGLYFCKDKDTTLYIKNCNDIHTFFFREPLDVVFLDQNNVVIKLVYKMQPMKRIKVKNARHVIERFASESPWYKLGDSVNI